MNYKDKYILFYLEGKKALSEKRVSRILGISYPDDMPDGYHGQIHEYGYTSKISN